MPPKTRSQTGRSRPPNPSSLNALDDALRNLGIEEEETSPIPPSSSDYDPVEERHENIEIRTTPRTRKITATVDSEQRTRARDADPNEGRCLITNRPSAVQLCHLIARATDREMLTKLEYVWGMKYHQLNIDTKHNMMHLRSDWHILFDKEEWVLIPEYEVLQQLNKIYAENKRATSDITKLFVETTYKYYVLPAPTLQEPICRFPNDSIHDHKIHFSPFPNLGAVESHVHPHFVIFNTGKKLAGLSHRESSHVTEMTIFLTQIVTPSSNALLMVGMIQRVYAAWMKIQVPDHYRNRVGTSNRFSPPSQGGRGDRSPSEPPNRQGPRSATRSQGQGSGNRYTGGQQRAILPFRPPEDDSSSSVTGDTVVEDDTDWIEYIHEWRKQGDGAAERLESDVLNDARDKQLASYISEHARTPPSPGAWDIWKPDWDDRKLRYPAVSDRSRFSSNDWAVLKNEVYLTRSGYPKDTL